jgi:hypothetical protein
MSKLGNLSFHPEAEQRMPEAVLPDVEGGDAEVATKQIVEPQRRAFMEFAEPVALHELPELIATHFFQRLELPPFDTDRGCDVIDTDLYGMSAMKRRLSLRLGCPGDSSFSGCELLSTLWVR